MQLCLLLGAVQDSERRAKAIEDAVAEFSVPQPIHERLQQLPGVGKILSMVIALETGDISRFANAGCFASYCRTVPSRRDSNHKKKGENNRRNGNPYLAWALMEAATMATRHEPQIQAWYERKKRQTNSIVARKALASKMAKAAWHVMNGKVFEVKMLFG